MARGMEEKDAVRDGCEAREHPLRVGDLVEATVRYRYEVRRGCVVEEVSSYEGPDGRMWHYATGRFRPNNGGWSQHRRALGKPWRLLQRAPTSSEHATPEEKES